MRECTIEGMGPPLPRIHSRVTRLISGRLVSRCLGRRPACTKTVLPTVMTVFCRTRKRIVSGPPGCSALARERCLSMQETRYNPMQLLLSLLKIP